MDAVYRGLFATGASHSQQNSWTPIAEITPPTGSTVSILFIKTQKIYYRSRRNDAIFPADKLHHVKGLDTSYYINSLGHATVMACVDRTDWRDPEYGNTWSSMDELPALPPKDQQTFAGIWLMRFALINSNILQSIDMRLTSALDAQSRVSNFISMDMPDNQWEIEVEHFFRISLARIQINARNIARGVFAKYDGWHKASNNATICADNYHFQAQGWTNVNYVVSLLILIPCVILIVLAIPSGEEELWPEPALKYLSETSAGKMVHSLIVAMLGSFHNIGSKAIKLIFNRKTWRDLWYRIRVIAASVPTLPNLARRGDEIGRKLEMLSYAFFSGHNS